MKSEKLTVIACRLADCLFYEGHAAVAGKILCSHKDVPHYLYADPPCPLYRLDWQKKVAGQAAPPPLGRRR